MNIHDIMCVALYEAKQQGRKKEFYLFVLFSLVGITLCHVYWLFNQENWKIMALPCSIPLVNAYLFCVIQSLFATLFVTDFPRRERIRGALESILSRPINNSDYLWGKIIGNIILSGIVNLMIILLCLIFVHFGSDAPYRFGYYLFYFLTLNIPSLVFIMGISLWIIRLLKNRFITMFIVLVLLVLSIGWLPFLGHGIWDFLGSGVPNLFSDITGHVGLLHYTLHRLAYFFMGMGFISLSIYGMSRIPNNSIQIKKWNGTGVSFIFLGIVCGFLFEYMYIPDRKARKAYLDSFQEHWNETCCNVTRHDILVRQAGDMLYSESKLTLQNLNTKRLENIILFLNPGLQVVSLKLSGQEIPFRRNHQVIIVDHPLGPVDSVHLNLCYMGKIDERLTDLHLSDAEYENSFRGDLFFPTGRRSAYVDNDYLLLTPASIWYPVTIPPVNPLNPTFSGRDYTHFTLTVAQPHQKILCSQGKALKKNDTCYFKPSRPLAGVSLCGGDYELQERNTPNLTIRLYTFKNHLSPFRKLPSISGKVIHRSLNKDIFDSEIPYRWSDMDWYEKGSGNLYLMETPLPFITEGRVGRERTGHVEPGMLLLPEGGFDLELKSLNDNFKNHGTEIMLRRLLESRDYLVSKYTHPLLGLGNNEYFRRINPYNVYALLDEPDLWIKSEEFPFVGFLFNQICLKKKDFSRMSYFFISAHDKLYQSISTSLANHSLFELMQDVQIKRDVLHGIFQRKSKELLDRLLSYTKLDTFYTALTDVYRSRHGIISMDLFARLMDERLGMELEWDTILRDWLHTDHGQYFVTKDLYEYYYPANKMSDEVPHIQGKTGWVEVQGQVKNCGKTGGVVTVEFMNGGIVKEKQERYTCYLKPGEAKAFHLVCEGARGFVLTTLNTGLSANYPQEFSFERRNRKENKVFEPLPGTWSDLDTSAFSPPAGEIIVDNNDVHFSVHNAKETWFQKWFKRQPDVRNIAGAIPTRWTPSVEAIYHGDSVRSAYFKGFGDGTSTATWRVNVNEEGKYRIEAKVYRYPITMEHRNPQGVVYYYTINYGGKQEQVAAELDRYFEPLQLNGWVPLGEFNFHKGEISITLSDYDELGRAGLAVVADAIRLQKLED